MRYHPAPEITARSYLFLRSDIEEGIRRWMEEQEIDTAYIQSMRFLGSRVLLTRMDGSTFFRKIDRIPYGDHAKLQRALRLRDKF